MDKKKQKGILETIEEVSGLRFDRAFKSKPIPVLLGNESKSNPLTVKWEAPLDMADNLVHELIHVLFTQNYKRKAFKKKWDTYMKDLEDEPWKTRCHVAVHAVHLLYAKKVNSKRIKRIRTYSQHPDYLRSWYLVDMFGAQFIVDMLK